MDTQPLPSPDDRPDSALIEIRDLIKNYGHVSGVVQALRGISFKVWPGEFVSIMGQSGSGKSTLLHVLGCLHQASEGHYFLDGQDVSGLDDAALSHVRNHKIGMVFQKFNLLNQEDLIDNVTLPLVYARVPRREREERARVALEQVGLSARLLHKPSQLSGGQSQRVAIARALVSQPVLILADEPTGNLDSRTGAEIMGLFQTLHRQGRTIIQVTHDQEKAEHSQRIIHLKDGLVERVEEIDKPRQAILDFGF